MKRILIDECPAGAELDAAVVRMLWSERVDIVVDFKNMLFANSEDMLQESLDSGWIGVDNIGMGEAESFCLRLPGYSTGIAAAWKLANLEKMAVIPLTNGMWSATPGAAMTEYWNDSKHEFTVRKVTMGYYERYLNNDSLSDTAPLAITRAYLKAKGVEFVEVEE